MTRAGAFPPCRRERPRGNCANCWSTKSPNPPQPITPNPIRPSTIGAFSLRDQSQRRKLRPLPTSSPPSDRRHRSGFPPESDGERRGPCRGRQALGRWRLAPAPTPWRRGPLASQVMKRKVVARKKKAEEVGFKPTVPLRHTGFRDRPFQPLRHPSEALASIQGRLSFRSVSKNLVSSEEHSTSQKSWLNIHAVIQPAIRRQSIQ